MFFTRLYDRRLAQASYIVGCQVTREALVVDPNRDIASYVAAAAAEHLRIRYVTETHVHADFLSGARELAAHTGAQLLLSGEGGPDWQYDFAAESTAKLLHDRDVFTVGNIRVEVLHTPGHTPEHISFLVTDVPSGPHPVLIMTGDFVFVGDVGRPDLLEKAAKQANTMEAGARQLWQSLTRFRALPDHVQVWPGHGAGSACGKALGAVPSSTVGYEKLVNWGLTAPTEDVFVRGVLEGQPEPPAYFARMKQLNKSGPATLGGLPAPERLDGPALAARVHDGAVVLDIRPSGAFARGHARGSINVPLTQSFTTYAGSVVPHDTPLVVVTPDEEGSRARDAARELALIGIDGARAFAGPAALAALAPLDSHDCLNPADAMAQAGSGTPLIDVRNAVEWSEGHAPSARHIPLPQLAERIGELPRTGPVLVQCQSGARSAVATSMLRRAGIDARDIGGLTAWVRNGGTVVTN